ncbi:hypothetical protein [Brytella acorum]|uniref:Uncharacterized protein n=1 Tax=Brytella acorum TaxID=2959299 RepID=A0AA35Y2S5_9PROT|nr:hypothetical protein [Brytella acorum]CAI9119554.1 hypothetical protein LMG32879_000371 [Brytella acorum]
MTIDAPPKAALKLTIEGLKLEELPLSKVAEYIRLWSNLLGSSKDTHLTEVTSGSVLMPISMGTAETVQKVVNRLLLAKRVDGGEARAAFERLDDALALQGGYAWVEDCSSGNRILELPGVHALVDPLPPFWEEDMLQGRLLGINFRTSENDTSGRIQSPVGIEWFHCGDQLATELAPLYLQPLRLRGDAHWQRRANGDWKLLEFVARSFEPLKRDDLRFVRENILKAGGFGFSDPDDAYAEIMDMRE